MENKFGTDGIRGTYGVPPMNESGGVQFGWGAGTHYRETVQTVVLGEDPRESSSRLAEAVSIGITEAGINVERVGVIPSPGLAFTAAQTPNAIGCMITASHNGPEDNGYKLFATDGRKITVAHELAISGLMGSMIPHRRKAGSLTFKSHAEEPYVDFLRSTAGAQPEAAFDGLKLVLDAANGAASYIAPGLFESLGAKVIATHDKPTGRNINQDCGAASGKGLAALAERVRNEGADAGVAFDGDADRLVMVTGETLEDGSPALIDGDTILHILAHEKGYTPEAIVGTVMTNLGLQKAVRHLGVDVHYVDVGDRNIRQKLDAEGWDLGGEQSGHILTRHLCTGDGMLTAIQVMKQVHESGKSLSEWRQELAAHIVPQGTINIPLPRKEAAQREEIWAYVNAMKEEYGEDVSILLRPSGTEPLLRLTVQATNVSDVLSRVHGGLLPLLAA